ncbi:MAG: tetratricopeptide repeat protein [Desulfobulbaceae bacterium]|nr:tetratricopeptide repeat protein [Desulfobulbaceae bacterium]
MSQQSAFDRRNIEESAVVPPPGLLEQLNLPPALITFLRKNQRTIWIVTGCIAFAVISGALYGQYRSHLEEKAANALVVAMQAEGAAKKEQLVRVVDEFGSTSSGVWARIELAHLAVADGDLAQAIREFNDIKNEVSAKNPVTPLLLNALGALYEKNNELDKAVAAFSELSAYPGFEAGSYEAMGRLYEQQGRKAEAVEMYRKSLAAGPGDDPLQSANPNRETIQARINSLQD